MIYIYIYCIRHYARAAMRYDDERRWYYYIYMLPLPPGEWYYYIFSAIMPKRCIMLTLMIFFCCYERYMIYAMRAIAICCRRLTSPHHPDMIYTYYFLWYSHYDRYSYASCDAAPRRCRFIIMIFTMIDIGEPAFFFYLIPWRHRQVVTPARSPYFYCFISPRHIIIIIYRRFL